MLVAKRSRMPHSNVSTVTEASEGGSVDVELAAGARVGRYMVLETIGRGGMGVVYAAFDTQLERKVAIKLVRSTPGGGRSASAQARLLREAQVMAKLRHPNVVAVHDVGAFRDGIFLAMELVEGETLAAWLTTTRALAEKLRVLREAGRGLAAAHAAGLVHRDFKEANVLLSNDGRVLVTDFGVARADAEAEATTRAEGGAAPSEERITETGALLGTIGYMAPEHLIGDPVDHRADQFSFSVAAYAVLYGKKPFPTRDVETYLRALYQPLPARPEGARVPAWVDRVIVRGLSSDPKARFSSMDALLVELGRDPSRARRRRVAGVAAVVVAALVVAGGERAWRAARARDAAVCSGADGEIARIWNADVAAKSERAFLASGAPFAPAMWPRARAAVDDYAKRWSAARTATCAATNVAHTQPTALETLRVACLEERRQQLATLAHLLVEADAKIVENSVKAATQLSRLEDCDDVRALTSVAPLPGDPDTRAAIARARDDVAAAQVRSNAGQYAEARDAMAGLVERARTLGYDPLTAEALVIFGQSQAGLGDWSAAAESHKAALLLAERARAEDVAVRAAIGVVNALAETGPFAQADVWLDVAEALVARAGDRAAQASWGATAAWLRYREGRYADAATLARAAVSVSDAEPRMPPASRITLYQRASAALAFGGAPDEGIALLRRADEIIVREYADTSPKRIGILTNTAVALLQARRFDEALRAAEEGIRVAEASGSNAGHLYGRLELNYADALQELGRNAEALAAYDRALASLVNNASTAKVRADLEDGRGTALLGLGRASDAAAAFTRALALYEETYGKEHPQVAIALMHRGEAALLAGDTRAAVADLERALARDEAHAIGEGATGAVSRGRLRFTLARALAKAGARGARTRKLAIDARRMFEEGGEGAAAKEVEAWLAAERP